MSLRVDLMNEEEQRYQGAVSKRFMAVIAGAVVVALASLWVVMAVVQGAAVKKETAVLEGQWNSISSRYEVAKGKQATYTQIQSLEKELQPWSATHVVWAPLFDDLNAMVPASVQITRLAFRTEWSVIKPPAPPPQEDPDKPVPPPPPGVPARTVILSLAGVAAGHGGADEVVKLMQGLKASPGFSATFETFKLQNMVLDATKVDEPVHSFAIEAPGVLRKLQ